MENLSFLPTQSVFLFYTYCTTVQIVLVFTPYTNLHVPFHVKYVNITVQIGLNGERQYYLSNIVICLDGKSLCMPLRD